MNMMILDLISNIKEEMNVKTEQAKSDKNK